MAPSDFGEREREKEIRALYSVIEARGKLLWKFRRKPMRLGRPCQTFFLLLFLSNGSPKSFFFLPRVRVTSGSGRDQSSLVYILSKVFHSYARCKTRKYHATTEKNKLKNDSDETAKNKVYNVRAIWKTKTAKLPFFQTRPQQQEKNLQH